MLHTVKQEAVEMKEINIPVGISDFKEICKNGYYYVDKTFLIKELLKTTATKVTLITRPRRFGKTMAMSMLATYFDIRENSQDLFDGLEISKETDLCKEWMNQWPVVFLSLKDIDGLNFEDAYERLVVQISNLYKNYTYLLEYDKIDPDDRLWLQNTRVRFLRKSNPNRIKKHIYKKSTVKVLFFYVCTKCFCLRGNLS